MNSLLTRMVCILGLGLTTTASAATLNVPGTHPTIGAAIEAAADGDTVVVGPGTYAEILRLTSFNKQVTVRSSNGAGSTTITGNGVSAPLYILNNSADNADKNVTFEGFTFANGRGEPNTSPVTIDDAKPSFVDCVFENNSAPVKGGAVLIFGPRANVTFDNCIFRNNNTGGFGGAVLVNGEGCQAHFTNCEFENNSNRSGGNFNSGGALQFTDASGSVVQSTFRGNSSTYSGGAVMIFQPFTSPPQSVDIIGCVFEDNFCQPNPSQPDNPAPTEGGAVHIEDNVDVTITECYFENNTAESSGGVNSYRGDITIRKSVFENCRAVGSNLLGFAGAIGVRSFDAQAPDYPTAVAVIEDTMIRNCVAPVGGGIFISGDSFWGLDSGHRGSATLTDVVIENCRATKANNSYGNGGGIFLDLANFVGTRVYVINNVAEGVGGGFVSIQNTALTLNDSYVVGNSADITDAAFHVPDGPAPVLNNTQVAYNDTSSGADLAVLAGIPSVSVNGKAHLVYLVLPTSGTPSIVPSIGGLPKAGGISAGSTVDNGITQDTTYTLDSQYPDQFAEVKFSDNAPPLPNFPGEPVVGDFDGDGEDGCGVYYAPLGDWKIERSSEGLFLTQFGFDGTLPVVGDFDGDGKDDFGAYFAPGGNWFFFQSTEGFWETQFGFDGTLPVVGDFDGDGEDDFGAYFAPGGNWFFFQSTKGFWETQFGFDGTLPVVGDFDGDGKDDFGCYFAPGGNWFFFQSTEGFRQTQFGFDGTLPVVGDFDGDGKDDFGCYFPPTGDWYFFQSTEGFQHTQFGFDGTLPVVGDFDSDGKDDFGAYYPGSGEWYLFKSTQGFAQLPPIGQ